MNLNRVFLEKIFWGVLLIVIAVSLIVVWVTGWSILLIVPLVLLGAGIWVVATGPSYFHFAWGVVMASSGGLWLLHGYFSLSLYIVAAAFLTVIGVLVIAGSRK
jgi:hypothetical protein